MTEAARCSDEGLSRSLRFVDVYALAVGGTIGVGIFSMPGKAAAYLGPAAVVALLIGAALTAVLALCFAEVGSRFRGTGGAMTYARFAFGDLVGFEVGWATWIARVASWPARANFFVMARAELWPAADGPTVGTVLITGLIAGLTVLNLRGVGIGGGVNTLLTAAKLVPILLFIVVGAFHIDRSLFTPFAPRGYAPLGEATVALFYAYVGFEGLVIPAAEMRDPQRQVPRALLLGVATIAAIYVALWAVCTGTLPTLAGSDNPVGEAADVFLPALGSGFVQCGIVLSTIGINAFMALVTPRMLYAMGCADMLPAWFARVSGHQVPVRAILVTSAVTLALALTGTFEALAVASVVARMAQYIPTALAVPRLRAMPQAPPAAFRVPFGPLLPGLAVATCAWLLVEAPGDRLLGGAVAVGGGLLLYLPWRWGRR